MSDDSSDRRPGPDSSDSRSSAGSSGRGGSRWQRPERSGGRSEGGARQGGGSRWDRGGDDRRGGSRDDRGRAPRRTFRDDDRGSHGGSGAGARGRDDRGGYRGYGGGSDGGDRRGGFRSDRSAGGPSRGGFRDRDDRSSRGDGPRSDRGPYQGRDDRGRRGAGPGADRGGFQGRDDRGSRADGDRSDRGGYQSRDDRGSRSYGERPQRGGFQGRDDRGSRSYERSDRGGYQGRDDRGSRSYGERSDRGGYQGRDDRGSRSYERSDRGGYQGRDERGSRNYGERSDRGGYQGRDDRGSRSYERSDRGGYQGRDDRGSRSYGERSDRGGFQGRDDRGSRSYGDRSDRGGYQGRDDRGSRSYGDRSDRGGYQGRDDRGSRGRDDRRDDRGARGFGDRGERGGFRDGGRGRPERGGAERTARGSGTRLTPTSPRLPEPRVDDDVTGGELDFAVRRELRTLSKDNASGVAAHLVMVGRTIDDDLEAARAHAETAVRRAGRVAAVRETLGLVEYRSGRWAQALAEFRTARRIAGDQHLLPLMVDCERALGRPERALDLASGPEVAELTAAEKAELRIVVSGIRRDLGQLDAAAVELRHLGLDPARPKPWSARAFYAYADVLLAQGDEAGARTWFAHALDADPDLETDAAERLDELDGVVFADLDEDGDDLGVGQRDEQGGTDGDRSPAAHAPSGDEPARPHDDEQGGADGGRSPEAHAPSGDEPAHPHDGDGRDENRAPGSVADERPLGEGANEVAGETRSDEGRHEAGSATGDPRRATTEPASDPYALTWSDSADPVETGRLSRPGAPLELSDAAKAQDRAEQAEPEQTGPAAGGGQVADEAAAARRPESRWSRASTSVDGPTPAFDGAPDGAADVHDDGGQGGAGTVGNDLKPASRWSRATGEADAAAHESGSAKPAASGGADAAASRGSAQSAADEARGTEEDA